MSLATGLLPLDSKTAVQGSKEDTEIWSLRGRYCSFQSRDASEIRKAGSGAVANLAHKGCQYDRLVFQKT